VRSQWGFGDEAAKDQFFEILAGKTRMERGATDGEAETIIDKNGNRVLLLNGYKDDMTLGERLLLGVNIQHEAYRDGEKTADNALETQAAVRAHTEMALRIAGDSRYAREMTELISGNVNLQNDIGNYYLSKMLGSDAIFNAYVDAAYDSSADYWKLVKDENGKWDWDEDGSLDFNFDLGDKEIRDAFFKTFGMNPNNVKGTIGTIAFSDMTLGNIIKLGVQLGIKDPPGPKLTTPEGAKTNFALGNFVTKTMGAAAISTDKAAQVRDYTTAINQLIANGVGYGYEGQEFDNYVVNADSTTMDCIGLISYLNQMQADYNVANFSMYKSFEKVTTAMPGDVITFIAQKGTEYNNHVVGWLGNLGPQQGATDQIFESAWNKGPRFSTLSQLTNYYTSNGYNYTQSIYRLKK
jgi:hypothetical protein